jgi:autotransporter passenger strand-loop-strand repeat protein
VLSGGYEFDGGTAFGTVISAGGHEQVAKGGATSGSVVGSGGREVVSSGGQAARTIISGGELYVSSGGQIALGLTIDGGLANIAGTMSAGQTVRFTGSSGVLSLHNLGGFHAKISGLHLSGQEVDLAGFAFSTGETATWTQAGTSGTLTVHDGAKTANLVLIGAYATSDFHLAQDGHGGTFVTDPKAASQTIAATRFAEAAAGLQGGRLTGGVANPQGNAPMTGAAPLAAVATTSR